MTTQTIQSRYRLGLILLTGCLLIPAARGYTVTASSVKAAAEITNSMAAEGTESANSPRLFSADPFHPSPPGALFPSYTLSAAQTKAAPKPAQTALPAPPAETATYPEPALVSQPQPAAIAEPVPVQPAVTAEIAEIPAPAIASAEIATTAASLIATLPASSPVKPDATADSAAVSADPVSVAAEAVQISQNAVAQTNPALNQLIVPDLPPSSLASRGRIGTPASTISTPSAFGAGQGSGYVTVGYQASARETSRDDAGVGVGFGVGDPREDVAIEVGIVSVSTIRRTIGENGTLSVKLHRLLEEGLAVAVGAENFIRWGDTDGGSSVYGVATKRFDLAEPDDFFSAVTLSGGVGTGRFRDVDDIRDDYGTFNVFGAASLQVAPPVSVTTEWSGQDLGVGLSVAPFANVPLTINAAVVDLTGNADSDARFVAGVGFGFNF